MRLPALGFTILLAGAHAAAGPNWQVTSFSADPRDVPKILTAAEALMASEAGRARRGTIALVESVLDGSDPATHAFLSVFDSVAEREAWSRSLRADPAWQAFLDVFAPLTEPVATSRMSTLRSWGEPGDDDVVWELHTFTVSDVPVFAAAIDAFLTSDAGEALAGQVHLSQVAAAGLTDVTHVLAVGSASEAEAEVWNDHRVAAPEWASYVEAVRPISAFRGTFVLRTLRSWGPATSETGR